MVDGAMNPSPAIADTYAAARQRFVSAVAAAGAVADTRVHPGATGPDGGALSVDTAWFGPRDAAKVLVSVCGTHGQEGFAGASAQLAWLAAGGLDTLPEDVAVFLIHGLNPWGWAHFSRTTENNVDLNRNFVTFDPPPVTSPVFGEVDAALRLAGPPTHEAVDACWGRLEGLMAAHGPDVVSVISGGQYIIPDMINYGGAGPEWSNRMLADLLQHWVGHAEKVACMDWHTGVGSFGKPFFLVRNPRGSAGFARAEGWWGPNVTLHAGGNDGMPPVAYRGLVWDGAVAALPNADLTGGIIEFGTFPPVETMGAIVVDQWLRRTPEDGDPARDYWRQWQVSRLHPGDPAWGQAVCDAGVRLHASALAGLGRW